MTAEPRTKPGGIEICLRPQLSPPQGLALANLHSKCLPILSTLLYPKHSKDTDTPFSGGRSNRLRMWCRKAV